MTKNQTSNLFKLLANDPQPESYKPDAAKMS